MKGFKFIVKIVRAMCIAKVSKTNFDSSVRACANISWNNNALAFIVKHSGPFGGPIVEQIGRPDVVVITEMDNHIVVKDGKVYKLTKWVEYGRGN